MQFSLLVSIVLQIALTTDIGAFTSIPDILNGIGEVEVHGKNSVILVGDFPELKLCEGSANAPATDGTAGGEASCCIKLFHDETNPSPATVTQPLSPTQARALQGSNCKANGGRRKLSECPSGTFEVAHACQDFGFWCHEDGSVVSGCVNCDLCDFPSTCPGCHNERRSLQTKQTTFVGYSRLGDGHCVDSRNVRPPHCWGSSEETVCRELCTADTVCSGYEYGQNWGGNILCQLVYDNLPAGCPHGWGLGGDAAATEIIRTYPATGASCWKKSTGDVSGKMKIKIDAPNSLVLIGKFPQLKMCEGAGNAPIGGTRGGDIVCCVVLATKPQVQGENCAETRGRRNLNGLCPDGSFDIERACRESADWCHQTEGALDTCLGCNNCVDPKTCPECTAKELKI